MARTHFEQDWFEALRRRGAAWLENHAAGHAQEARELAARFATWPDPALLDAAQVSARAGHGDIVSYSRKVFIPLTRLCRDVCAYCTFAQTPSQATPHFLDPDAVLKIARDGQSAGCKEALFTLGDKPEWRYAAAREALAELGFASTADYLAHVCALVLRETGLLPHVNAGVLSPEDMARLRDVSVSQGTMLETVSTRLLAKGAAHAGAPDKDPDVRIGMLLAAGDLRIPFTTGLLIGIGETFEERILGLLAIRDVHREGGHIQEVIVQNFRAKPATRMAAEGEPDLDDLLHTLAIARLVLGPAANIQAPPNLSYGNFGALLTAGINDWGGVSPVTIDHVNPEAPWPEIARLRAETARRGHTLTERLAIYPPFAKEPERWVSGNLRTALLKSHDSAGFAREDRWVSGAVGAIPAERPHPRRPRDIDSILTRAEGGGALRENDIEGLFEARGGAVEEIASVADEMRARANGDTVSYVVTRNINYTNVCALSCRFCAFSKGRTHENLRGKPYDLDLDEIMRRAREAWDRGATEVCMQGGIAPHYTGETYLAILRAVKEAVPGLHVHAFSPLEIAHGAQTLGLPVTAFLERLQRAGLGSLPGTAAEILDDEIRAMIAPGKMGTDEWLSIVGAAHAVGLKSTTTIMFGHIEKPRHWARHLRRIRALQERSGGVTEFVPLPFVPFEAPMFLKGLSRMGPTWREVVLMHAVSRIVLGDVIPNVQASWVKLGADGVRAILSAGVNDLGGTLMDESISRAAGARHGQEFTPVEMEALIAQAGRSPRQRTTLYGDAPVERQHRSRHAAPLADKIETPWRRAAASGFKPGLVA